MHDFTSLSQSCSSVHLSSFTYIYIFAFFFQSSDKDQFFPITASQRDLLLVAEDISGPLYFGGNFSTVQPGLF